MGGVLSQCSPGEDQERVIAYFSQALSSQERHYCVTRRELLAVVKAIKHFHAYLYGKEVSHLHQSLSSVLVAGISSP